METKNFVPPTQPDPVISLREAGLGALFSSDQMEDSGDELDRAHEVNLVCYFSH